MIALPNHKPSQALLPLLRTLFDITLLRKGPDNIPSSMILLLLAIGLWLFSSLAVLALMIVRIGVPVAGIWLLGAALKHAVGPHRNSR